MPRGESSSHLPDSAEFLHHSNVEGDDGRLRRLKDAAQLAQKADNIELYRNLLEAMEKTLEQQKMIQDKDARIA